MRQGQFECEDQHLLLPRQPTVRRLAHLSKGILTLRCRETSYANGIAVYVDLIKRDLAKMVDLVVPEGQEGILNAMSSLQVRSGCALKRHAAKTMHRS